MSEPTNTPYPQERTPEQHVAVRRRSLPVAVIGAILGVAGLVLMLSRTVTSAMPPNVWGVQLAFCALLVGVGILFYARGTSGTGLAAMFAAAAIILGLAGTGVYAVHVIQWRRFTQGRELENAAAIATAAAKYAHEHGGAYPPDIDTMLDGHYLTAEEVHSPFSSDEEATHRQQVAEGKLSQADFETWFARHSDYQYLAPDLRLPEKGELPREIIVAAALAPVNRTELAIAYVDGRAEFIDMDTKDKALQACNDARATLKLGPVQSPEAIERAKKAETQPG